MKYEDTYCLRRIDQKTYKGWQFCCRIRGLEKTKFFSDSSYSGENECYLYAKVFRDSYFKKAKEANQYDNKPFPIELTLSSKNTSGIIGVGRSLSKRKDSGFTEIRWQANYKNSKDINSQKCYSVLKFGEISALRKAVEFRKSYIQTVLKECKTTEKIKEEIRANINDLDNIVDYLKSLDDSDEDTFLFIDAINNKNIKNTNKKRLLETRIGQNKFRKIVLRYWNNKCAITGATILLTASHIKPWRRAKNSERLDVYNGISLSPVYDKAFDEGFISFKNSGEIMISSHISKEMNNLRIQPSDRINDLCHFHKKYLKYHRNNIFKK